MKRKLALTLTCFSILTLLMTGCGEIETAVDAENTTTTESENTDRSVAEPSSGLAQADLTATPEPTTSPEPATRNITSDSTGSDTDGSTGSGQPAGNGGTQTASTGSNGSMVSDAAYEGDPYAGLTMEEIDAIYANMTPEELMAEAARLSNAAGSSTVNVSQSEASFKRDWAEQVFALVNAERAEAGLNELVWDEKLYDIAVQRCYENDVHASMRAGTYENYGFGSFASAQMLHNGWHNSQGHHDNYMRSDHDRGAVAVYSTGNGIIAYEVFSDYGHLWTNPDTGETETIPVDLDNPYISNFQWLDDIPDWAKPYLE